MEFINIAQYEENDSELSKETIIELTNKNMDLQQRIDKAIEYIEKLKNFKIEYLMLEEKKLYASEKDFVNDLLDILRGESNE